MRVIEVPSIPALTFDDVTMVPNFSEVRSRRDPKLSPNVSVDLGKFKLDIPIISAPMNTVTGGNMVLAMSKLGASSVLHRYMSIEEQIKELVSISTKEYRPRNYFVAVGATGDYLSRIERLYDTLGLTNFCVDTANGHSVLCLEAVEKIKNLSYGDKLCVMAGNVCSREGAFRLADVGTDIVRVGVGPGSMCKTRVVTGHGVPQLTAIDQCALVKDTFPEVTIVADGGIRNSGDIVKALAAGADTVMLGGLLAGTDETPGDIIDHGSFRVKRFAGMASKEGRKFNGWFTEEDASFVPEGEATEVPYKGSVRDIVTNLIGGLKVGMSYSGALTLQELQENAQWARVTENGRIEGTPHGKSR
jgi:IMP dehydrogenase